MTHNIILLQFAEQHVDSDFMTISVTVAYTILLTLEYLFMHNMSPGLYCTILYIHVDYKG